MGVNMQLQESPRLGPKQEQGLDRKQVERDNRRNQQCRRRREAARPWTPAAEATGTQGGRRGPGQVPGGGGLQARLRARGPGLLAERWARPPNVCVLSQTAHLAYFLVLILVTNNTPWPDGTFFKQRTDPSGPHCLTPFLANWGGGWWLRKGSRSQLALHIATSKFACLPKYTSVRCSS